MPLLPRHGRETTVAEEPPDEPKQKAHNHKDPPPEKDAKDAPPAVTPYATPIASPLITPVGSRKATHFTGPVVSGHPGYLQGQAILAYEFDVDVSNGTFTGSAATGGTIQVHPGTILWRTITVVGTAFNGTSPTLKLGTTSGASDIASISLGTVGNTDAAALSSAYFATGGTLYVSLTATGTPTTGHATVALLYLGPAAKPWN